jgi:hypothetical protein
MSLSYVSVDHVILDPVLTRLVDMPDIPIVRIHKLDRRWILDACCGEIHLSWDLTQVEATAALDESLDALELHRLTEQVEVAR